MHEWDRNDTFRSTLYPLEEVLVTPEQQKLIERNFLRRIAGSHAMTLFLMLFISAAVSGLFQFVLTLLVSTPYLFSQDSSLFLGSLMGISMFSVFVGTLTGNVVSVLPSIKTNRLSFSEMFKPKFHNIAKYISPRFIAAGTALCFGINFLSGIMTQLINDMFPFTSESSFGLDIESIVFGGRWTTIFYVLLVAIVAPITEEMIFRGAILKPLRRYGDGFAIVVSAVLFGFAHGNLAQTPFAFVMGLLLGYYTVKSNSILPAILLHFINNGLVTLISILLFKLPSHESELLGIGFMIFMMLATGLSFLILILFFTKRDHTKPLFDNVDRIFLGHIPEHKAVAYFTQPGIILMMIVYIFVFIYSFISPMF